MLHVLALQPASVPPTLWEQIQPTVVTVLIGLIPVLGATLVAWLRAKQQRWELAQQATLHAEEVSSQFMGGLSGKAKMAVALDYVHKHASPLARMSDEKAKTVINRALRESQPGAVPKQSPELVEVPSSERPPLRPPPLPRTPEDDG